MIEEQKKIARILLTTYLKAKIQLLDEFDVSAKDFQKCRKEIQKYAKILEIEEPKFDLTLFLM